MASGLRLVPNKLVRPDAIRNAVRPHEPRGRGLNAADQSSSVTVDDRGRLSSSSNQVSVGWGSVLSLSHDGG